MAKWCGIHSQWELSADSKNKESWSCQIEGEEKTVKYGKIMEKCSILMVTWVKIPLFFTIWHFHEIEITAIT